jgi:hypothetical protein
LHRRAVPEIYSATEPCQAGRAYLIKLNSNLA